MIFQPSVGERHREHPELAKATTTDGMVTRHTDRAARSLCPTSLPRNGGSSYSEEPGVEIL